jgi:hypothetical protein
MALEAVRLGREVALRAAIFSGPKRVRRSYSFYGARDLISAQRD